MKFEYIQENLLYIMENQEELLTFPLKLKKGIISVLLALTEQERVQP